MSDFQSVVTAQKTYICAVYSFIVRLLRATLPEVAWNSTFTPAEDVFAAALDGVIRKHALDGANEGDCCLAMAQAACMKMMRVCGLLKRICISLGQKETAEKFLDAPWFVDMLLAQNTSKLNKLLYTIDFTDDKPSRLVMNVAAILDDNAVAYDSMSARAKRKADSETKELIRQVGKKVETLNGKVDSHKVEIVKRIDSHDAKTEKQIAAVRQEICETKEQLLAKADAVIKKCGKANLGGRRKSRHSPEQKKVCLALWMDARENEELKDASGTGKATHEAAFNWYKRKLALVGVTSVAKFKAIIHTVNNTNSAENIQALEAKREAERKAKSKTKPCSQFINYGHVKQTQNKTRKCGKIRGMKKVTNAMFGAALSIFAVAAPCMASDASANAIRGGLPFFAARRSAPLRAA